MEKPRGTAAAGEQLRLSPSAMKSAVVDAELPILASRQELKVLVCPETDHGDDGAGETATVALDGDDGAKKPEAAPALGFVERMVREYTMKREIHALIHKKQQQLKQMQALMAAYQDQLAKSIDTLEEELRQLKSEDETTRREARRKQAEILVSGVQRPLVETTRSLGLLQVQRNRLRRERAEFRLTLVRTRQEECEWLLKSIVAQHDQECETLLSASTARKFLEEGSLQATLAVQITQDDPIFAPTERLFESQPHSKQLKLQIDSIEALISTLQQRCDDLESHVGDSPGPVPLTKRHSFGHRRLDSGYPTGDRKRALRLCLLEGKQLRHDRSDVDSADQLRKYSSLLTSMVEILQDVRTRSGSLLLQFVDKLRNDTHSNVRITRKWRCRGSQSNQDEIVHDDHDSANVSAVDTLFQGRYIIFQLPPLLASECELCGTQDDAESILPIEAAIDSDRLPPPAMITAFTKFLARVIATEYGLVAPPPSVDENSSTENDLDDHSREDIIDQTVLHDCVHELVFRRIAAVASASAIHEYLFNLEDEPETSHSHLLYPWHWQHSKSLLQGLSPNELAFPDDAILPLVSYLEENAQMIKQHGFLPKTLSLFRAAERETTPKGIVRAVMAAFKMLHCEISRVLSQQGHLGVSCTDNIRPRPLRRGSTFLNADVLIPAVVLMITRLPHTSYLDGLWHRSIMVEAFRSSALCDSGEESYYLTCLAAAMEFVNTFDVLSDKVSSSPEPSTDMPTSCLQCQNLRAMLSNCSLRVEDTTSSPSTGTSAPATPGRPRLSRAGSSQVVGNWSRQEHESIKQLSKWISDQPPTDGHAIADVERFVASHELWLYPNS